MAPASRARLRCHGSHQHSVDRQPRRDRRPDRPRLPRTAASARSPCTPTRTATPCTCKVADEAYALGGATPARLLPGIDKLLDVAAPQRAPTRSTPATASWPRTPSFAQAVIDAGLIWIGPSPEAIDALGDKVKARHIAERVGAPLVPGTPDPVVGRRRGRRLRRASTACRSRSRRRSAAAGAASRSPARSRRSPSCSSRRPARPSRRSAAASASSSATSTSPRHVETQCLADAARQRRRRLHPRLLAAAPPPEARRGGARAVPHRRSRTPSCTARPRRSCARRLRRRRHLRVPRRAGRHHLASSRSTPACRSSTRSPRRSPASTWSASSSGSPTARSSTTTTRRRAGTRSSSGSTARTPGRDFLPAPGVVTLLRAARRARACASTPASSRGDVIGGAFDSMLAKLIVTGATAQQALERSRRALDEFVVEGMPTVLPFHRAVVRDPAFAPADAQQPFTVHTRWIETEFDEHDRAVRPGDAGRRAEAGRARAGRRRGRRQAARGRRCRRASARRAAAAPASAPEARPSGRRRRLRRPRSSGDALTVPDAGHHRQGRRRGGSAGRRRATWSSCSRR